MQSGVGEGVNESYDRLDELLEKMMREKQGGGNHMKSKNSSKKEQARSIP
jgi:hypothetical protein